MSALALLLVAVGLTDLVAARDGSRPTIGRLAGTLVGLTSIAALALLADLDGWGDVALLGVVGVTTGAWAVLVDRAERSDSAQGLALAALAAGVGVTVLFSGWASNVAGPLARWLDWSGITALGAIDPTRAVLLLGLFLTQLSTGNAVVRLVLARTGALDPRGGPQAADRLRGGRLLGPMERVFILGLGLAGQVTAASVVIAAKGLIRWPELQRASRDSERREQAASDGTAAPIDQVTEYFLIGSFVSWLVALAALAVAHLA
ncbi:hypothetical protein FNH13_13965 [Ornithinimicrobium ciconiae]|uniref:Uncharacterized protein n=1 Tax=Ornithinimicrobium ciconiae TaxID=2594265 RepID=A0A516GCQ5_9MICO|nr:hypothetical protein [Ornithinimicrobium ciconiae]QDO89298.1 hypothetical protein FNH13_13965 [Ornithinimicrobium ciconiae]